MKTVVAVLRGGPSSEYEVSLKSGAQVLRSLTERYEPRDIFIDRDGVWHVRGMPMPPERALRGADVVFNTVHGEYGEDGRLHHFLDAHGIPYTGPERFATTLAFNKERTRDVVSKLGVTIPRGVTLEFPGEDGLDEAAHALFRGFSMPAVIKPVIGGSSVGVTLAKDFHSLTEGLARAFSIAPKALVEEYIRGTEATVGVIDNFRGQRNYALMPVEIVPSSKNAFFDYDAKYGGSTLEICPGSFSDAQKERLEDFARRAHAGLGMRHYSRSDFIVGTRGVYFLETNSAPGVGLTEASLLPRALRAVGSSLEDFVSHVVELARSGV